MGTAWGVAGEQRPVVWALHVLTTPERAVLLVVEPSSTVTDPPGVHAVAMVGSGAAERARVLAARGWSTRGLWQPRPYGSVCQVVIGHPEE
jgi:hypothetical protein